MSDKVEPADSESRHRGERAHPRKLCSLSVCYDDVDSSHKGVMQNISLGGGFIETNDLVSIGQEIFLTIPSTNNKNFYRIKGEVVRLDQDGLAIKFIK